MTQKKLALNLSFKRLFYLLTISIFSLSSISCGVGKDLLANQEYNNYPGTIYLINGEKKTGNIGMPTPDSNTILLIEGATQSQIDTKDVDRIEYNLGVEFEKTYIVRNMTVKGSFGSKSKKWLMCLSEGPNVSAYIGANTFKINIDGSIGLGGTRQVMHNGNSTMIVNPSFPVYMMKKGDEALSMVALTEGVSFEDSAFRSGISRFLSDDPQLCEYVREEKWGFDNLNTIVQNYDPLRGNDPLSIDGVLIGVRKRSLFTNDLDKEMLLYVESVFPSDDNYGVQFGIGIRSTISKFFTYGVDLGYASAKYIDATKRIENHPGGAWVDAPVEERDLSKQSLFRVNGSIGGQLPFNLKKVYLIPGAHLSLGATLGTDYSTFYYGPMGTFDIGFKLKHGNILIVGGGYRHIIPLKGDDGKEEASAPGFKAYEPYGNLLVRVAYKF